MAEELGFRTPARELEKIKELLHGKITSPYQA